MTSSSTTEKTIAVPTSDGHEIICLVNEPAGKKPDRLVIIAHGLTGHPNEYLHKVAHRYFTDNGYSVVRLAFYGEEDNQRRLRDCTLAIHALDLNAVIRHFSPGYKKVFVIGHSYGGLTTLIANPEVSAVSFWDSSYQPYESFWSTEAEFLEALDCYKIGWHVEILIGKAMYEEARDLSLEHVAAMAKAFRPPAQVVLAGDSNENPHRAALFEDLSGVKELCEIDGAGHCFYEGDTGLDLLENTRVWFDRF